jgi:hypothetical protein
MSTLDILLAAKKDYSAGLSVSSKPVNDGRSDVASLTAAMQDLTQQYAPPDCLPQVPTLDCVEPEDCNDCVSVSVATHSHETTRIPLEQARQAVADEICVYGSIQAAGASYAAVVYRHLNTTHGRLAMMKSSEDTYASDLFAQLSTEYSTADADMLGFLLSMHRLLAAEGHPPHLVSHCDHEYDCIAGNGILSSASKLAKKGMGVASSGIKAAATAAGHSLEFATVAATSFV